MQNKRFPCEIAVWRILPTIRSEIAKELARIGLPQMVISKRLGITQPAVSQYVTKKRGTTFAFSDDAQALIHSLAKDVAHGEDLNLNERMCEICANIQGTDKCTFESVSARNRLQKLKEANDAVILAHNYQRAEVQDAADYVGDSFELSKIASELTCATIVFCGVDFMAEIAAILSPDKEVLLPVKDAMCPMSKMMDRNNVRKLKKRYPKTPVVCYVNTSADVKAECDVCCTSANAIKIINELDADRILFVPDRNLGDYLASKTDKEVISWDGFCPTHQMITLGDVLIKRQEQPDCKIVVHPECRPEVIAAADYVYGTGGMLRYAARSDARHIAIGTEVGMLHRLATQVPNKEFSALTNAICPNMKRTNLEDVIRALEQKKHRITVPEDVRKDAKKALDKMLEMGV
jgi:quinolinate synthase